MANNAPKSGSGLLSKLKRMFGGKKEDKDTEAKRKEALRKAFDDVKKDIDVINAKKAAAPTNLNAQKATQAPNGVEIKTILDAMIAEKRENELKISKEVGDNTIALLLQESILTNETAASRESFSGIHEIYRKETPFGLLKTNGRQIEIEYFDVKLLNVLMHFKIVPLFKSASDHTIVGFYELNISALQLKNVCGSNLGNKEVKVGTLRAPIFRKVDKECISEEDALTLDTLLLRIDEILKQ